MESGGNRQRNEERSAEKLMDNYLKSIGLHRKKIAKDGSCLFRAVAEQVLHCQSLHTEVRAKCVEFLKQNRDSYEAFIEGDFEEYLCKLQDPQQWVGEVEMNALAVMYKRDFQIFQEPGRPPVNITDNKFKDKVQLCFLNGNHYDSVYPISSIKSAALCQSILYELLYDSVFKVDQSSLGLCQRVGRSSDFLSDDNMPACGSSDESDVDTDEPLWVETEATPFRHNQSYRGRGRGRQLPERARRSLNPTLLRNIEYDVWLKSKRAQQKIDYGIAAGMQFTVGDRCQVREGGRSYNATIKEVPPGNGLVTVHIEDLGKKQVPLWSLRSPGEESSWCTVVSRDRKLSNGHGEWEERGRGRGRGKLNPAPSSVSKETAGGSSGRVQKQNSWPPQASVEGQAGGKTIRKSLSTTESALGPTEIPNLAEEEEIVEDLEMQLKDDQSFPALGTQPVMQYEGGRKKGGEKRRPLRSKAKSPVEDLGLSTPSAGEKAESSSPPLAAVSAHSTNSGAPANTPSADSDSAWLNSCKASTPCINTAAGLPPAASAANTGPASSPPAPTTSMKPPLPSTGLRAFITPVLPAASSPPASSFLPTSAASPPPSPSVEPPTFIAPIAPTAAQVLPRSFSPITSLPHSPSPPSSSSLAHVKETPPARPTSFLPKAEGTQMASETFQIQAPLSQMRLQVSVPQNQNQKPSLPEGQGESRASLPQSCPPQQQPQPNTKTASEPQSPHPLPGESHPPIQPPDPSQVPHPPPSFSGSTSCSSAESASVQNHAQAPPPPQRPPSPPQPTHHVQSAPPHPPPQPMVPLQKLSQIYQDPLYPGFPQGEKGEMAAVPAYSASRSGDDLPQDVNVLRFFFNLGVRAYSTPMFAPYFYLIPLQQTYYMQPKPSSPSPPPPYAPPNPTARQQGSHTPPHYPPTPVSVPSKYDGEPAFSQAGYQGAPQPPSHRMPVPSGPWLQVPPPRNASFPAGYPAPTPPYSGPPPSSQGCFSGQGPLQSMYPTAAPQYPPVSVGYQSASTPEEFQAMQGMMESLQPSNGDPIPGHGHLANLANVNSRTIVVSPNCALKEGGEGTTRAVLLVDPPLNNKPILALISDPEMKDSPVTLTTMKSGSSPGSPSGYRGHRKPFIPTKPYQALGAQEPGHMGCLPPHAMAEPLSVACGPEEDFEMGAMNYTGQRKSFRARAGRPRGGYDGGRGPPRRRFREAGEGQSFLQFNSSYRGQGRGRGY
ncbi:unnamed protein product [Menidia menidia]|uniref:ubiquitinyl hydrolase 1 n=1 Tax=Menidia menidia TaxID=238744 RepID=A0A8S4B4U9_9TELE|nr:unnamed protein product [Menidia menidia]